MASRSKREELKKHNERFHKRKLKRLAAIPHISVPIQMSKPQQELVKYVKEKLDSFEIPDKVPATPKADYVLGLGKGFWERCNTIGGNRRWVDGYFGQCNWNTAVVILRSAQMQPNGDLSAALQQSNLKVYRGYGYFLGGGVYPGGWCEHTWCMDDDCLIETTGPFSAYFGAELNEQELAHYVRGLERYDPVPGHHDHGWTVDEDGERISTTADAVEDNIGLPKKKD